MNHNWEYDYSNLYPNGANDTGAANGADAAGGRDAAAGAGGAGLGGGFGEAVFDGTVHGVEIIHHDPVLLDPLGQTVVFRVVHTVFSF